MNRRRFSKTSSLALTAGLTNSASAWADSKPLLSLGVLTDLHYADKDTAGSRHYRESLLKATEAAAFFKESSPGAVVCLGDLIDAASSVKTEISWLQTITATLAKAACPRFHVLGNHCVATLTKGEFFAHAKVENPKGHHSCDLNGVHLVILDACFNHKMEPYERGNFKWTDANVPPDQIAWFKADLKKTKLPTVVFVHQRLDLPPESSHAIKQSVEIRKILADSKKVVTVLQGHSHKNEHHVIDGVSYCTLAAVVEGAGDENNAYGLLQIYPNGSAQLEGYRKLKNQKFVRAPKKASDAARWEADIARIEAGARENPSLKEPYLWVGSSSARLWDLKKSFPDLPSLNHGFGGSEMSDSVYYADRIITPFEPKVVFVYAGDNDINKGKSAERVVSDFQKLVAKIHKVLPSTDIVFLPIKPSLSRWKLWPEMKSANSKIADLTSKHPRLHSLDTVTGMLGKDSRPKPDIFKDDGLHLNEKGYQIWTSVVQKWLRSRGD